MYPRVKCLALLVLLVVSFIAVASAARPDPAFHGDASATRSQSQLGPHASCSLNFVSEDSGGGGEEECLMRRAPQVYIDCDYSVNKKP
ncbi:hypothetical protein ACJRO7_027258 [Eucalyptus globulus]|uniref:Uncharacterized protein n=1 Tax=Eucalyptus globulus TaxID=34317 RepID=A0ABD3JQJ4_EUCGL